MNGKYIGVVIGAVVAIMLVGGVLMPIIDNASTQKETTPAEGAYGPDVAYFGNIESGNYVLYRASFSVVGGVNQIDIHARTPTYTQLYKGPRADLPDKMILYADDNLKVWLDNDNISYSGVLNGTFSYTGLDEPKEITIQNSANYGGSYTDGDDYQDGNITYYYVATVESGEYSNFIGDNPPTMDTPTVTAGGMYIGPKEIVTETHAPGYAIYVAIPLIILVALLTAVAFVAFRRDY